MENKNDENIENSYILREYFKGFKLDSSDLAKIKEKINKIDRSIILDRIVQQDAEIYNIVGENYSATIEIFEKISDEINRLNQELGEVQNNLDNFSRMDKNSTGHMEPASIKQINLNINEHLNKIQQFQNEIHAKNNLINNQLNQIKEDEQILSEVELEKELYIESISEESVKDIKNFGFSHSYQLGMVKIIFEFVLKINVLNLMNGEENINEENLFNNENIKSKFWKEFKREISNQNIQNFKNLLKECQTDFIKFTQPQLREIKQSLDSIKIQADSTSRDKIYENFFHPVFKCLKLIIFISFGRIRTNKIQESIEKERNAIDTLNNKIKDLFQKKSSLETLKYEISKKYATLNTKRDNFSSIQHSEEIFSSINPSYKIERKEIITNFKLLHNNLENNYILLLKNLSKKLIKPKDLIRKVDISKK